MNSSLSFRKLPPRALVGIAAIIATGLAFTIIAQTVSAQDSAPGDQSGDAQSTIHPAFPLLDASGENVLASRQSISTMKTCGACHDTAFIATHSFHTDVGLNSFGVVDASNNAHEWDQSDGTFGKWNPLTYRFLSGQDDTIVDLTTAEWIMLYGERHVGGGPAETSRGGEPLSNLAPDAANVEASVIDQKTGEAVAWDWQKSGTVEMDCFLCHTPDPNNEARIAALRSGQFGVANTATLLGQQIVVASGDEWLYYADAFDNEGNLKPDALRIQDPSSANCGLCHGTVHASAQDPLTLSADCAANGWETATTGQIVSPQKLSNSGANLQGKESLARTWDVHAERVVKCTACHYALNNPVYYQAPDEQRPDNLTFDPRRIDFSEYLQQPLHQFAKGDVNGGVHVAGVDNTLRDCESCHNMTATHNWLPYKDQHMQALDCETCHAPKMNAPAIDSVDWTVLQADGKPVIACRGVESDGSNSGLITGFTPILLPRQNADGSTSLGPNNVVTAWYWVYGSPARPVPERDLTAAWLDNGQRPADVIATFDTDKNGSLDAGELIIDSAAKQQVIAARLSARGLDNPRIAGEAQPYSISHGIAAGEYATRECSICHTEDSRISQPMALASRLPGGVIPVLTENIPNAHIDNGPGGLTLAVDHAIPTEARSGIYVFGHDSVWWIDWLGIGLFVATLLGIVTHGGLRFFAARRTAIMPHANGSQAVYMYGVYERLWHWLQTVAILLLVFTGLIIHKPDKFSIFAFEYVVQIHNIVAALLVINAALSLFYHLVSGEIRQYLPQPYGFFDDTIVQAKYYLNGIFNGAAHPFEKTPQRKLNPLQQITYFGILNVLLPLQILTGILMWGAQQWPEIAARAGGLPWLAPFHTLVAWLFATFVVMHVYLTTTGHTPLANIKAMMLGWDEVETQANTRKA